MKENAIILVIRNSFESETAPEYSFGILRTVQNQVSKLIIIRI